MMKFGESAARMERRDDSVDGFVGGYGGCVGYGVFRERGSKLEFDAMEMNKTKSNSLDFSWKSLAPSRHEVDSRLLSQHTFPAINRESRSSCVSDSVVLMEYLTGGLQKFLTSRRSAMNDNRSMRSGKEKLASQVIDGDLRKKEAPTSSTVHSQKPVLEMPSCDGTRVSEWIVDVEYFYKLGRYSDEAKLDLVFLCLQGALKKWYGWVRRRGGFKSWTDFKQRLVVRFSESTANETVPEFVPVAASTCSSPEVLLTEQSTPRVLLGTISTDAAELSNKGLIHEKESLQNETISAIDHEKGLNEIVSVSHVTEVDDLSLNLEDEVVVQAEQVAEMFALVPETDMVKQMALLNVDVVSVSSSDCHISSCTSAEVIFQNVLSSEAAQETELTPESLQEMKQKTDLINEISANACVDQSDSSLETVSKFSLVVEELSDRMNSSKESVHETGFVSNACLVTNCLSPVIMLQRASRSETQLEAVVLVMEGTMIPLEQNMDLLQEHKLVQQMHSSPPFLVVSDPVAFLGGTVRIDAKNVEVACVHHLCDHKFLPEQKKNVKTWKFKFKTKTVSQLVRRQWAQLHVKPSFKELRDVHVALVHLVQVQRLSVVTLLASEQQYCEPKKKYCKSWHFKYKPEEMERKIQENHVLYFAYLVNHGGVLLIMAENGTSLTFWRSQLQGLCVWIERLRSLCNFIIQRENMVVAQKSQCVNQAISQIVGLKVITAFRVENGSVWIDSLILPCQALYHTCLRRKAMRWMLQFHMQQSLQALRYFSVGVGEFNVKHRWRFKSASVRSKGPSHEIPTNILFSPSMRANLFSRVGVYEKILICLLILAAWILRCDREQKNKPEMLVHGLFRIRVSTVWNHLLHQEKYISLIHFEGIMLRILIQQGQQWKRIYKSRMFKYKETQRRFIWSAWTVIEGLMFQHEFLSIQACGQACFQRGKY